MGTYTLKLAKEYTHTQTTPSTEWDIDYKMDFAPIVDVMIDNNGTLEKMLPMSIERITNSRVKIFFSQPFSGKAHLVG
jgi:hypothetical protein